MKKPSSLLGGAAFIVALTGLALPAHAGKILNDATGTSSIGWDTSNINTNCYLSNGTQFSCTDWLTLAEAGSYFLSDVYDRNYVDGSSGEVKLGTLAGKNYPVGEPYGIKIVEGDTTAKDLKPQNCIMTTSYLEGSYLDDPSPEKVVCGSPFQSHKRYKLRMLPTSVADGAGFEKGVDLVFKVQPDATTYQYQVFQKINNWTDSRLDGYKLELGFGVGAAFQPASNTVTTDNINVTVNNDIWAYNELANFAHGLFGPADKHFPPPGGFFDNTNRAGYEVDAYIPEPDPANPVVADTPVHELNGGTTITATLGSTYATTTGAAVQFGDWLPYSWIPLGIFYDNDSDPSTDAEIVAWWGDDGSGNYTWMKGQLDSYAPVSTTELESWDSNPLYSVSGIEDLVNLGLNYIVNIGTVDSSWPTWDDTTSEASFTIRITPKLSASQTPPGYTDPANQPTAGQDAGLVSIGPDPVPAVEGQVVYIRVLDANDADSSVDVTVTSTSGDTETLSIAESTVLTGAYSATLPISFDSENNGDNGTLYVTEGDTITVTYHEDDDGTGSAPDPLPTDTTTIATTTVTPPPSATITSGSSDGGCVAGTGTAWNITMPAILAALLGYGFVRRRRKQQ